jgi:hypothetical protein
MADKKYNLSRERHNSMFGVIPCCRARLRGCQPAAHFGGQADVQYYMVFSQSVLRFSVSCLLFS